MINFYVALIVILFNDERELGVVCVDMGGEICNFMIYSGNFICYNKYLFVGFYYLIMDLLYMFNILFFYVEEVKIKYGDFFFESGEEMSF